MFEIQVTGDKELIARLGEMPGNVRKALLRKVNALALTLLNQVQGKLRGPVLNYVTGRLFRSIQEEVTSSGSSVIGRAFSSGDVKYAAIHEYGGTINIPEIVPTKAQALHFVIGGKDVFAKRVAAHDVVMPERSYMRSTLDQMRAAIVQGLRDAVAEGLRRK
jgi:phage gpG-like protein